MDHGRVDEPSTTWSGVARLLWREVRDSRLLPSALALAVEGVIFASNGAGPWLVIAAVGTGFAGARAVVATLEPARKIAGKMLDDYLAGAAGEDTIGATYWAFRAADAILPPLGACLLAQQMTVMLPLVPAGFGTATMALAVLGLCTTWAGIVVRRIRRRQGVQATTRRRHS